MVNLQFKFNLGPVKIKKKNKIVTIQEISYGIRNEKIGNFYFCISDEDDSLTGVYDETELISAETP